MSFENYLLPKFPAGKISTKNYYALQNPFIRQTSKETHLGIRTTRNPQTFSATKALSIFPSSTLSPCNFKRTLVRICSNESHFLKEVKR